MELPTSAPLAMQQFVVPRGKDAATQLSLANTAGLGGPRTLSTVAGRNSWPMLSNDRRTIIYINYVAGTLRTMAADGSGDRPLIGIIAQGMREHHSGFLESRRPVGHDHRVSHHGPARPAPGHQA